MESIGLLWKPATPKTTLPPASRVIPPPPGATSHSPKPTTDAKDTQAALREYGHALELAPDTAAIHRDIALLLWSSGRKDEAIDQWQQALGILRQLVDTRVVPESFWIDFAAIAGDCHQRGLIIQLRSQMDAVLRAYIAKNGDYRSVELLHSAFMASASPSDGVDWILSLSGAARYPETLLSQLDGETWLPREQLGRILRRELELAQAAPPQLDGTSSYLTDRVRGIRLRLLQYLLGEKKDAEAQALYESIPERERAGDEFQRARIVLAAHQGEIPRLLVEFSANPDAGPATDTIAQAASQLRDSGDRASNHLLLEYIFDFKSARHELAEADFLALAQARLDTGEVPGAVELLHRFTLFSPDLYGSLDSAAGLLEKSDHSAEALPFLTTLANNTPWKPEYRLRLATARLRAQTSASPRDIQSAIADLTAVAASGEADYATRTQAAIGLKGRGGAQDLHSAELTLLASGKAILPEQADKPYFLPARMAAANAAPATAKPGILRKAIAVAPSDALRLSIFRAEFTLAHNELALAAIQPLLESPGGYVPATGSDAITDSDADSVDAYADAGATGGDRSDQVASNSANAGSGEEAGDTATAYAPVPSLLTNAKEKVDFALAVATLYERAGNDEQALMYARFAARENEEASRRAEIAERVSALSLRVRTERENNSRRPVIRTTLDQAVVVRPRITNAASQGVQP